MQNNTNYYSYERKELQSFIPSGITRTLDVGCASGAFSVGLKNDFGVETWGIEMVHDVAEVAKTRLDRVLTGTFDEVYDDLPEKYFDCIFFNDVLEHMPNPEDCLEKIKKCLSPNGCIIASIPNMRYINVLKELVLKKDWEYKESGIMDKTHLRFFTKKSMARMFDKCDYDIKQLRGIHKISPYCLTSIINALLFNRIEDVKYMQFVVVASPR